MKLKPILFENTGELLGYSKSKAPMPRFVILDLTRRCNLHCFMCNVHMDDTCSEPKHYEDMSDELFEKTLPVLSRAEMIQLGGCGEPFISRNILARLKRIREHNPSVYLSSFTNGLRFAEERFTGEALPLFNELHVSVNGVSNYESVMNGASKERLLKALQTIQNIREKCGKPERLVMGFILMKRNLDDIGDAAKLAKQFGFSAIQYKNLWVFDDTLKPESVQHNPDLAKKAKREIRKAASTGLPIDCEPWPEMNTPKTEAPNQSSHYSALRTSTRRAQTAAKLLLFNQKQFIGKIQPILRRSFAKYKPLCTFPWEQIQIFENGDVFLCCFGVTNIGDYNENDFASIWHGNEVRRYREGILSRRYYKDCARCKLIVKDDPSVFDKPK